MENVILTIIEKIKKAPSRMELYTDAFELCRSLLTTDKSKATALSAQIRDLCTEAITNGNGDPAVLFTLANKTLLFEAPYVLDSYLQFLEHKRPPEQRFYMPRRFALKQIVDAVQELVDDKLDELFISQPPRTGKSTLMLFLYSWIIGRDSEKSNLYSAYSDTVTQALYEGVVEIINDPYTYSWHEVFPNAKVVRTNAKLGTLDINRRKRYASLTCRSLYGGLNGACDCNGFLISDDLISGIEEALSKDRLMAAWSKVLNNLLSRAKSGAKVIWCGTRWSLFDPIGKRQELLENDPAFKDKRFKVVSIPALDPVTDESNFDYKYGVGYSTQDYREKRASFERDNDTASWQALYMQEPIERDGALFSPDNMRYYNGELPEGEPDRKFMAVDVAWGGGDFLSGPIAYQYGENVYLTDVIFDTSEKDITRPKVANKVIEHGIKTVRFEANNGGSEYAEYVDDMLKSKGYRANIQSVKAPNNTSKLIKIFDRAPEIRRIFFLENGKRHKEYSLFMQNLFSFKVAGKNKHDDAPDSLAQLVAIIQDTRPAIEVFARPF